jgi:hypothetical protein
VPGDHPGQTSNGLRWPYGPVALITPFNFPLEIPALQLMGALFMGNKPLVHVDHRVSSMLDGGGTVLVVLHIVHAVKGITACTTQPAECSADKQSQQSDQSEGDVSTDVSKSDAGLSCRQCAD